MRTRFLNKHVVNLKPQKAFKHKDVPVQQEIKKEIKTEMVTNEMISKAENVLTDEAPKAVKKIKKDKGLIERAESSKTIITEDNKQILFG